MTTVTTIDAFSPETINLTTEKKSNMKLIVAVGRNDTCIALPLTFELIEILSKAESVERYCSYDGSRKYTYLAKDYIDLQIIQEGSIAPIPVSIDTAKVNTEES